MAIALDNEDLEDIYKQVISFLPCEKDSTFLYIFVQIDIISLVSTETSSAHSQKPS